MLIFVKLWCNIIRNYCKKAEYGKKHILSLTILNVVGMHNAM